MSTLPGLAKNLLYHQILLIRFKDGVICTGGVAIPLVLYASTKHKAVVLVVKKRIARFIEVTSKGATSSIAGKCNLRKGTGSDIFPTGLREMIVCM